MNYNTKHFTQSAFYAVTASGVTLSLLFAAFFVAEPTIGHGQIDDRTFTISQTIVDETSFLVPPADVTMSGSGINGVTGGQATGTSQFSVISNNTAGYYVEIAFEDNLTDSAMIGDVSGSEAIRNYDGDVAGQPSFGYTASTAAQLAYTVTSLTTSDTDQSFLNNGSACDTGTTQTANTCWKAPSTAPFRIVDRNSAAITGATSTLTFNVTVPSGATPVPTAETYTATATLSLFVK